jgi:two-component SAPR family response regulator
MKVYLVDDEPITNIVTKIMVKKLNPEVEVSDFNDPVRAFSTLTDNEPNLIFLDLNMPEMTGWDFLDKMKELGMKHQVIILTSSVSAFDKQKATNYTNVIDFLNKPVEKESLMKYLCV